MQNQKTTSFSKILANKNNSTQVLTTQQDTTSNSTNPFYIDQTINTTNNSFLLNNFANNKNLSVRHKSWRSDTTLNSRLTNEDKHYQVNNNESDENRLDEEEEEDIDEQGLDDELDNSNLEFSDHAGLYEVLNDYKHFDPQYQPSIHKYDVYKLKRNYKLTFTNKNIRQMSRNLAEHNLLGGNQTNGDDSLVFSSMSGNQFNKFNFDDYVNNEESDEEFYEDEDDEENQEQFDPSTSYLDQISKDILFLNNTGNESQLIDENIMNWSMKLSAHEQFNKRSHSRSPKPKKNSIKQLKNFQDNFPTQNRYMLNTQFQNFNQVKNFQQTKLDNQNQYFNNNNKKSSSTTSWGKLKNSKSNSSNIGVSSQSITNSNDESNFSNNESVTLGTRSINNSQYTQTLPSNTSNAHLYKLFQNSKGNLNSTHLDETTSSSDLSYQYLPSNRSSRRIPDEPQASKKTSFSQLRQRSLSSCAIASNTQTETPKMKKSIGVQHEPESVITEQTDNSPTILCMVVDKNNKLNKKDLLIAAAKAKSMVNQAGVLKIQKSQNQTSKRSSSCFSTKHSLPDLTFLSHYSDKKPEPLVPNSMGKPTPPNPQSVQSDILKRKTLKSIKRYRQTKQNTEPCAVQIVTPQTNEFDENIEFKFERRPSLPFNERGKNPLNTNKQPLKSCLKRKESQIRHSQSLQANFNQTQKLINLKSTMMFVPFVGYLFSCDTDSSTRYFYYNNLEKNRRNKIYKQLTNEVEDEDEDNTEEEEERVTDKKEPDMCRSDNDLRIKKVVKFKPVKLKIPQVRREAPLLQYDTLIAMLKSSKEKKVQPPTSLNLLKNSNTIDADSISLASLSESPPSEFKFSDDEENMIIKNNVQHINNRIEHVKNLKRNFHSILLKDQKLNNLKEILLELKTQQEKGVKFDTQQCSSTTSSTSFSGNSSSTSTCSSITSPNLLNSSIEMKESIERLAGYLFDFLRQNIKPVSGDTLLPTSNLFKSTIESPLLGLKKPNQLAESNTLTQTFSQYTQIWNLIECTMNANIEQQRQSSRDSGAGPKCLFNLPKEAYLNMFQEINKFASSTNQTYLIDNSINTSQLRRKHHFMVMLMSLKFKFQLFIVYLLNHKQLPNWFEHVNRDRNLIKTFYDLKSCLVQSTKGLANNSSGDSGMGNEFMQLSTSSSTCSSSLSNSMTQNQSPNPVNEANFNVKSLTNVSIFENDEYFSYFHKLLQQFNLIEVKIQAQTNEKSQQSTPPPLPPQPPPIVQQTVKAQTPLTPVINRLRPDSKPTLNRNHIPKPVQSHQNVQNYKKSTSSINNQPSSLLNQTGSQTHSHSGFNLKNISKRFNIKSWFSSSNSSSHIPTSASHNNFTSNAMNSTNSTRLPIGIKTLTPATRFNNVKKTNRRDSSALKVCDVNGTGVLAGGVGALISNTTSNLMKHSLSEPSLNAILDR